MIYAGTINVERIIVSPTNDMKNYRSVELEKMHDKPIFWVHMFDHVSRDERTWIFDMSNPSDYERVKANVFNAIFECDTMAELGCVLDEIFSDGLVDILIG